MTQRIRIVQTSVVAGALLAVAVAIPHPCFAGTPAVDLMQASGKKQLAPAPAPEAQDEGLWFRVAPYVWITAINGDIGIGDVVAPVDITFSDTLDTLDFAYMGIIEFGYNRLSIATDVVYGRFSEGQDLNGPFIDRISFTQKQAIISPKLVYNVIDKENYQFDVYAGFRWSYLDLNLRVRPRGGSDFRLNQNRDWFDGMVGVRGAWDFADSFLIFYKGEIGTGASDFIWDAFGGLGYRVTEDFFVFAGYRGLGGDYDNNGFKVDTITHGPAVGLSLKF